MLAWLILATFLVGIFVGTTTLLGVLLFLGGKEHDMQRIAENARRIALNPKP